MDPVTLALFGPAIKDGFMSLIKKWTGDKAGKPANAQEAIQLMQAETEQLRARSQIGDTEGATYPLVIAVVKLQRPLIVYASVLTFLAMASFHMGDAESRAQVSQMVEIVVFWLFGERTLMKLKAS